MFKDIKAVLFDVDGTLYNQSLLRYKMALRVILNSISSPFTAQKTIKVIKYYRESQEILREKNVYSSDLAGEQIKLTSELSGSDEQEVKQIVTKWFDEVPLNVIPGCKQNNLEDTFERLYKNGFKLGLYSDYDSLDKAKALNIFRYISVYVSSMDSSVGVFKPDPKGFLVASEKLGYSPENVLYVGDRAEVDLKGANAAGMKAVIIGTLPYGDTKNYKISDLFELIKLLN